MTQSPDISAALIAGMSARGTILESSPSSLLHELAIRIKAKIVNNLETLVFIVKVYGLVNKIELSIKSPVY